MRRILMMPAKLPKATQFNWQFSMNYKDDESAFEVIGKMPNFQAIVFPLDLSDLVEAKPNDKSTLEYMKHPYPHWSCPDEHVNIAECQILTTLPPSL